MKSKAWLRTVGSAATPHLKHVCSAKVFLAGFFFLNIQIQNITEFLNGIEVWTYWWLWQCVNIMVVGVGRCQSCCVGSLAWLLCQDLRSDMAVDGGQQSVAQHIAQLWDTTNSDDVNKIAYIMIWQHCVNWKRFKTVWLTQSAKPCHLHLKHKNTKLWKTKIKGWQWSSDENSMIKEDISLNKMCIL